MSPTPSYPGRRIRAEEMSADEIRFFTPLMALAGTVFSSASFTSLLRHVNDRMVATAKSVVPHVEEVQAGIREAGDDRQLGDTRLSKYLRVAVPCRAGGESLVVSYSLQRRWDASPATAP